MVEPTGLLRRRTRFRESLALMVRCLLCWLVLAHVSGMPTNAVRAQPPARVRPPAPAQPPGLARDDVLNEPLDGNATRLTGHTGGLEGIAFGSEGRQVASASLDGTVVLSDAQSGKPQFVLPAQPAKGLPTAQNFAMAVAFAPDGKTLISGYNDGSVAFWNAGTGDFMLSGVCHHGSVLALAFSPDGKLFATGGGDDVARIWDVATHKMLQTLDSTWGRVDALAFSPDSKLLARANAFGAVTLWDLEQKTERTLDPPVPGGADYVWCLAFAPDGKSLAGGTYNNAIKIWDVTTGTLRTTWPGSGQPHDGVTAVAYAPDGKTIVVANGHNMPGPLELRDATNGAIIRELLSRLNHGRLAFAPDGKTLAIGDFAGRLMVYHLKP